MYGNTPLYLAPMAGVADRAFREICRICGADRTVSEMISAKAIYYNDEKTQKLADYSELERPFTIQLFGSDPEVIAYAARYMADNFHPDYIDLNMGCPVNKIVRGGDGSALMKNLPLAYEVVKSAVNASNVPVTVKMRAAWSNSLADDDENNAVALARLCEKAGAVQVAVHARTREQGYVRGIDLSVIRRVKQAVSIPVIGNGDIRSGEEAESMLTETGCDGLMIGRAAMGKPWIFGEIRAYLEGRPYSPPPLLEVINDHIARTFAYKNEHTAACELRHHICAYIHDIHGAAALRARVNQATDEAELRAIAAEIARLSNE
ncbi:MAG: tRNA dihydrouridine synthase DusB [Firmicutes bacterium]|nr:tRNA dihydrouridine synthase DusB [Bacillota bacterium]